MHINLLGLKREAKIRSRQKSSPGYNAELNALAKELYKVRDYHQLIKNHESQMHSHVKEKDGDLVWCEFCDFQFVLTADGDEDLHRNRHLLFEDAFDLFGFLPKQSSDREKIKSIGYDKMYSDAVNTQEDGVLLVLLGHYERSLEKAIEAGRHHNHPGFAEYVSEAINDASFISAPIQARLKSRFGAKEGAEAGSYWPRGSVPKEKIVKNHQDLIRERLLSLVGF